jgi:hypothetical protein
MKKLILTIIAAYCLTILPGCGNLSPRQKQEIDNQNGKIGNIENMANSMKAEIGKLQAQNDIQDSRLDRFQQGLLNMQSNNENSGIQIFSGPGGLVVACVGFLIVGIVAMHYRSLAKMHEKTANILAERIVSMNDPMLIDAVFQAAMHTNVEENILRVIKKHQLKI